MTGSFSGKTIAITGAAGGVGQWLCRFFGEEGATIAALDRPHHRFGTRRIGLNVFVGSLGIHVRSITNIVGGCRH